VKLCTPLFHVQLRRFPYSAQAFNLTDQRLHQTVLEPWVRGAVVELGDRRWVPGQTRLTVLEGPSLDASRLSLGRGWAAAVSSSEEVTERVLGGQETEVTPGDAAAALSSLMGEVLLLAAREPVSLERVWSLTEAQSAGWPASSTLAAAEHVAAELLAARQVDLCRRAPDGECHPVSDEQLKAWLGARQSWTAAGESTVYLIAREGEAGAGSVVPGA